jgi:hypothetical protein
MTGAVIVILRSRQVGNEESMGRGVKDVIIAPSPDSSFVPHEFRMTVYLNLTPSIPLSVHREGTIPPSLISEKGDRGMRFEPCMTDTPL